MLDHRSRAFLFASIAVAAAYAAIGPNRAGAQQAAPAPPAVHAPEHSSACVPVAIPRGAVEANKGKWIELTSDQWQFLRGVFVLNPNTPPGLPFGSKAALAQIEGDDGGLVFFVDGEMACEPMPIPAQLIAMMRDVATGEIKHEGSGL